MADVSVERPGRATATGEEPWRLRWGAIFGGAFVALGVWALLYVFGLAVGLVAADGEAGRFEFPQLFIGIWAVISPILALFVGGWVAARTAGSQDGVTGSIHGAVLWALTTVLGILAIWILLSAMIAGVIGLGHGVLGAAGEGNGEMIDVQAEQLLEPINQRLEEQGHEPLSAEELEAAVRDVINRAVRQGDVDQRMIEDALVANTGLQREDVREIAADIEQQVRQGLEDAEAVAARTAEQLGRAMWGLFFILLLGLVSAVGGAALGTSRHQQLLAVEKGAAGRL